MNEEIKNVSKIFISEDEMQCELCISDYEKTEISLSDLTDLLVEEGVVFGIDEEMLNKMINEKITDEYKVVANGMPPKKGRDGYYAYTFNINPRKKPMLLEDGSVDYLNLNVIQCVEEGDLLAKYFEKVDGVDGTTVKGNNIKCEVYKNLPPLRGKGITTSEDGIMYYAGCDGKVETTVGGINVSKISTIPGDVDISVGHVDIKGDLEILGNVCSGMIVKATGNITINGLVEAANIEAGKDLLVKKGILGGGKAKIVAKGNIYAQFMENAYVMSGNCVQADSMVNCIVEAYNDVNIFGKTSAIIGGSVKANRTIRTKTIGSPAQVLTRLSVGVEASTVAKLKMKEIKYKEEMTELEKIEKATVLLNAINNAAEKEKMSMLLTRTKIEKNANLKSLSDDIEKLKERINLAKTAEIVAEEMVYQGTIVSVDGINMVLQNDYESIVFLRKNDKILTKLFEEEKD